MIITPHEKDIDRALGLGNRGNPVAQASKMAKAIKDKQKLLRRSLAVSVVWRNKPQFDEVFKPFKDALVRAGFDSSIIQGIETYPPPKAYPETKQTQKPLTRKQIRAKEDDELFGHMKW